MVTFNIYLQFFILFFFFFIKCWEAGDSKLRRQDEGPGHGPVRERHDGRQPLQRSAAAPLAHPPAAPRIPCRRGGAAVVIVVEPRRHDDLRHTATVRQLPELRLVVHRAG